MFFRYLFLIPLEVAITFMRFAFVDVLWGVSDFVFRAVSTILKKVCPHLETISQASICADPGMTTFCRACGKELKDPVAANRRI
jgi:hypothetical protein